MVTATVSIRAIGVAEDVTNEHGIDFEDADSHRGAAGWLVFVSSAVILYNINAMMITCGYHHCRYAFKISIESHYAIIVSGHITYVHIQRKIIS